MSKPIRSQCTLSLPSEALQANKDKFDIDVTICLWKSLAWRWPSLEKQVVSQNNDNII